jgi:hypothetical protein
MPPLQLLPVLVIPTSSSVVKVLHVSVQILLIHLSQEQECVSLAMELEIAQVCHWLTRPVDVILPISTLLPPMSVYAQPTPSLSMTYASHASI